MENNMYFIAQSIFGGKFGMVHIINVATLQDNVVQYENAKGEFIETNLATFSGTMHLISQTEVDIKGSLYYWFKKNQQHLNKPIEFCESIENGEKYQRNAWMYGLLLNPTEDKIQYKFILE